MKRELIIIKAGTTFPETLARYGDFDLWVKQTMGPLKVPVRTVNVEKDEEPPAVERCAGVVATGSHAMVTDNLEWSLRTEKWISSVITTKTPFFGICYGHQLLARAAGGVVGDHPRGMEFGTVPITLNRVCNSDPIFSGFPGTITGHATHIQTVLKRSPDAFHLAANEFEPNHAIRVGPCAWGVQFHPEFSAGIMRSYLSKLKDQISSANTGNIDVNDTPDAAKILRRFGHLVEVRDNHAV